MSLAERVPTGLVTAGLVLGMLVALVLGVGGLVVAALVGGPWGVFVLAVFALCTAAGVIDWYALRPRSRPR